MIANKRNMSRFLRPDRHDRDTLHRMSVMTCRNPVDKMKMIKPSLIPSYMLLQFPERLDIQCHNAVQISFHNKFRVHLLLHRREHADLPHHLAR
jgi:hypothetical protein